MTSGLRDVIKSRSPVSRSLGVKNKILNNMNTFDPKKVKDQVVQWIRDWFEVNGKDCNAVIGISGGKDSSVVAGLCVEALGVDRVIGVTMPNGVQPDIDDSMKLINHLGIRHCCVNIGDTYNTLIAAVKEQLGTLDAEVSRQTTINLPPRLRMSTLYAVSQSMNGRVANTCNLSEDWVGYSTRYGDAAGDFAPLGGLTVQEVKALIDHKHITNLFKLQPIPHFEMK